MPLMGNVKQGASLKISITCGLKNQGITLVDLGANPVAGEDAPEPDEYQVAPGATEDQIGSGKVPTKITRLYLDVTLPDGGTATLRVQSGKKVWTRDLDDDASWLFLVSP